MKRLKNRQWQVALIFLGTILFAILAFVLLYLAFDRFFGNEPIESIYIRLGVGMIILIYGGLVLWIVVLLFSKAMSIDHFDKLERMQNESQISLSIDTQEFPKNVLVKMMEEGYQLETKTIQIDNNVLEIQIAQKKIARKLMIPYLSYFVFVRSLMPGVEIDAFLARVTEEIDRSKLVKNERMVQFSVCFIDQTLSQEVRDFCQSVYWNQPPQFVFLPIGVDLNSGMMISLQGCKGISKDLHRHMDAIQHFFR